MKSAHTKVRDNVIPAMTGKKWKLYDPQKVFGVTVDFGAIRRADQMICCSSIVGAVAQGRMGLEFCRRSRWKEV